MRRSKRITRPVLLRGLGASGITSRGIEGAGGEGGAGEGRVSARGSARGGSAGGAGGASAGLAGGRDPEAVTEGAALVKCVCVSGRGAASRERGMVWPAIVGRVD